MIAQQAITPYRIRLTTEGSLGRVTAAFTDQPVERALLRLAQPHERSSRGNDISYVWPLVAAILALGVALFVMPASRPEPAVVPRSTFEALGGGSPAGGEMSGLERYGPAADPDWTKARRCPIGAPAGSARPTGQPPESTPVLGLRQ